MSELINKFCVTLNTSFLDKISIQERQNIKPLLVGLNKNLRIIPSNTLHIFYMLLANLDPITTIDINKKVKDLTITNFCDFFIKNPFTLYIKWLHYTVYNYAIRTGLKPDISNINIAHLQQLYSIIDRVYFNGMLQRVPRVTLDFALSKAWKNVAGWCKKNRCYYTISIAPIIHAKPFEKYSYQEGGGVTSFNPLDCLIGTFVHELTHFIIFILCPKYNVPGGHSQQFKQIMYNLFGHTDYRHTLGLDVSVMGVAREDIKNWKYVYYQDNKEVKRVGSVIKLNPRNVILYQIDGSIVMVPYVSIYKEKPKGDLAKRFKKPPPGVAKNDIKGWKYVYYQDNKGVKRIGSVIKLNPRNVILDQTDGSRVMVSYVGIYKEKPVSIPKFFT